MGEPVTGLRREPRRSRTSGLGSLRGLRGRHHELHWDRGESLGAAFPVGVEGSAGRRLAASRTPPESWGPAALSRPRPLVSVTPAPARRFGPGVAASTGVAESLSSAAGGNRKCTLERPALGP